MMVAWENGEWRYRNSWLLLSVVSAEEGCTMVAREEIEKDWRSSSKYVLWFLCLGVSGDVGMWSCQVVPELTF